MEHILIGEIQILDLLSTTHSQSPEDFLDELEESIESGELTMSEAIDMLKDFNSAANRSTGKPRQPTTR